MLVRCPWIGEFLAGELTDQRCFCQLTSSPVVSPVAKLDHEPEVAVPCLALGSPSHPDKLKVTVYSYEVTARKVAAEKCRCKKLWQVLRHRFELCEYFQVSRNFCCHAAVSEPCACCRSDRTMHAATTPGLVMYGEGPLDLLDVIQTVNKNLARLLHGHPPWSCHTD